MSCQEWITNKFCFVFLITCPFLLSCIEAETREKEVRIEIAGGLQQQEQEMFLLLTDLNREDVLKKAAEISDMQIEGSEGKRYLELKLLALTICGEYEDAYNEIKKGLQVFTDDYVLLIGECLLANKINVDSNGFYLAYNILKKRTFDSLNEHDLVLKYYLSIVLNMPLTAQELVALNASKYRPIISYYSQLNKDELYLAAPLNFIIMKPILTASSGGASQWFEEIE